MESNSNTEIAAVPAVRIMFMGFFTGRNGPLADVRVRQVINYAIDADLIRHTVLGGRADLIGQLLLRPGENGALEAIRLVELGIPSTQTAAPLTWYGRARSPATWQTVRPLPFRSPGRTSSRRWATWCARQPIPQRWW